MTEPIKLPEPVAWISTCLCVGPEYGKERFDRLPVQSMQPGYYTHEPLFTADQLRAAVEADRATPSRYRRS